MILYDDWNNSMKVNAPIIKASELMILYDDWNNSMKVNAPIIKASEP